MATELARTILQRAYELEAASLDAQARRLGTAGWHALTSSLEFSEQGTGGGCTMLVAALPHGCSLGITDGEAGVPGSAEHFWVGLLDEDEEMLAEVEQRA